MSGSGPPPDPRRLSAPSEPRARARANPILPDWFNAWWPALVWAAVIFFASTDIFSSQNTRHFLKPIILWLYPGTTQEQLDLVNFLVRKCAHLTEYFVFYPLVYRGVSGARTIWRLSWGLGAWLIVAAYSLLDEFHQSFTASRTASAWDSLLDSSGALFALLAVFFWLRRSAPRPAA